MARLKQRRVGGVREEDALIVIVAPKSRLAILFIRRAATIVICAGFSICWPGLYVEALTAIADSSISNRGLIIGGSQAHHCTLVTVHRPICANLQDS